MTSVSAPGGDAQRPWWTSNRALVLWCGLGAVWLGAAHLDWFEPLTAHSDRDGLYKLQGIADDPSFRALWHYFWGDDPQRVHTFRPLAAAALWGEWHLFGFTRWPYYLVNLGWLWATALTVTVMARRLRVPEPWATLAGPLLLLWPTLGTQSVAGGIATRHDELCTLFGLWALLALLAWRDGGGRRALWAYLGWALAACLSKEQGLILLPLGVILGAGTSWRRLAATVGGSVVVGLVYLRWYAFAVAHMASEAHRSHTFGGMLDLLLHRGVGTSGRLFAYNLAWYPTDTVSQLYAGGWAALTSMIMWKSALLGVLTLAGWYLIWRDHRRLGGVILLYKVVIYLPVLPLHDTWPWYVYMPHVLDPVLYAAMGCALWRRTPPWRVVHRWLDERGLLLRIGPRRNGAE